MSPPGRPKGESLSAQREGGPVSALMWRVAYADAELSAHELHLMRKVAGLLHVPDSACIAAKMRAKAQAAPDASIVPVVPVVPIVPVVPEPP
ncbi:MAG: TerB family tellurite resistance protein [Betaproteobacteria bacterium]